MLERIVDGAAVIAEIPNVKLLLVDREEGVLRLGAFRGTTAGKFPLPLEGSLSGVVVTADERISAVIDLKEYADDKYLFFATRNGMVKKTALSEYDSPRTGLAAVNLKEGDELKVRAARGAGFKISSTVRDRVLNEKASLLVRDAQMDQALKAQMSIVQQSVRSMMAVPLQTNDRVIGLIYVDFATQKRIYTLAAQRALNLPEPPEFRIVRLQRGVSLS